MSRINLEKLKTDGFWYLATPYSHPLDSVREDRAFKANHFSGILLEAGVHVYSPIWATHRACVKYDLPEDHLFWLAFNKAFIDPSVGVIVADIDGWRESKGCRQEIEYTKETCKPVFFLTRELSVLALEDA